MEEDEESRDKSQDWRIRSRPNSMIFEGHTAQLPTTRYAIALLMQCTGILLYSCLTRFLQAQDRVAIGSRMSCRRTQRQSWIDGSGWSAKVLVKAGIGHTAVIVSRLWSINGQLVLGSSRVAESGLNVWTFVLHKVVEVDTGSTELEPVMRCALHQRISKRGNVLWRGWLVLWADASRSTGGVSHVQSFACALLLHSCGERCSRRSRSRSARHSTAQQAECGLRVNCKHHV